MKALAYLVAASGFLVAGGMLGFVANGLDGIEVHEVVVPQVIEPQCPPYVPHTPLTEEELQGLARALDNREAAATHTERELRREIAELKAEQKKFQKSSLENPLPPEFSDSLDGELR